MHKFINSFVKGEREAKKEAKKTHKEINVETFFNPRMEVKNQFGKELLTFVC